MIMMMYRSRLVAVLKHSLSLCACVSLLVSCGEKENVSVEEEDLAALSPVEAYEEVLALRLRDAEELADLMMSIKDQKHGEMIMVDVTRLTDQQREYEDASQKIIDLHPNVRELARKQHPAFHDLIQDRAAKVQVRIMEQLIRIHNARYFGSETLSVDFEKCDLNMTAGRMARYLNEKMWQPLKAYLIQYENMVNMLEGIHGKVSADAYAVSITLQNRILWEMGAGLIEMEKSYQGWLPGFELYYHEGLERLRKKGDMESKRCLSVVLKLVSAGCYGSDALRTTIDGLRVQWPMMLEGSVGMDDPVVAMEAFCISLERMQKLLKGIKDPETADQQALLMVEEISKLQRVRRKIIQFQNSGKMDLVPPAELESLSHRAEDGEMAVSGMMARLTVQSDMLVRSSLLSHALVFYRFVLYQR